ncbi:putative bifunctional diguanylate cyclase/phosphodiesterase [Amorphus sp. 3PC139-8]|uniref:putative bifunctional diguanylate cyclase/phosphodiesterase n=1 Tax=Amorphus sp. 3PC139-8 TaxID=2735676 RepID=UPI00345D2EDD
MIAFTRTRSVLLVATIVGVVYLLLGIGALVLLDSLDVAFSRFPAADLIAKLVMFAVLPLTVFVLFFLPGLGRLAATEEELVRATRAGRIGTWTYDPATQEAFLGKPELALMGDRSHAPGWYPAFDLIHPDDVERVKRTLSRAFDAGAQECRNIYRINSADGQHRLVEARGAIVRDASGTPIHVRGVHVDISGRPVVGTDPHDTYGIALSLREQALNSVREGVLLVDMLLEEQPIIYANDGFLRLTGYSEDEVLGQNCRFLQAGDRSQPGIKLLREGLRDGRALRVTLRNYRKNGTMFWNELSLAPIYQEGGVITHYAGVVHDVTEAVEGLNKMREAAYQDGLTGIRNRLGFERDLEVLVSERGPRIAVVVLVNVRGMSAFNESYGMDTGDRLLSAIARRLRSNQLPGRLAARTGGNEFAFAFAAATHSDCERAVEELKAVLAEPFTVSGGRTTVLLSVGWATTVHGPEAVILLRNAEIALLEARRSSSVAVTRRFEPAMALASHQRAQMVAGMREAIARDELTFFYQPIVDLTSGRIVQVEALMRWHHPTYGPQSPASFIPLAEESGLIGALGEWGIDRAARFAARLARTFSDPIPVSVNVSGAQFGTTPVLDQLLAAVAHYEIEPNRLVVELTESVLADEARVVGQLTEIHEAGFKIAIDDFGTGYSSLSYLQNYPIQELKIDKGFVQKLEFDRYSAKIVQMCLELAEEIGCVVIAEGVETDTQADLLKQLGCSLAQGYLYARPMSEDALCALLNDWSLECALALAEHGPPRS